MKGKNLEFISQINRDGSGTHEISQKYLDLLQDNDFTINGLSMTFGTYIASGFNSFVVKIKKPEFCICGAGSRYSIEVKHNECRECGMKLI